MRSKFFLLYSLLSLAPEFLLFPLTLLLQSWVLREIMSSMVNVLKEQSRELMYQSMYQSTGIFQEHDETVIALFQ